MRRTGSFALLVALAATACSPVTPTEPARIEGTPTQTNAPSIAPSPCPVTLPLGAAPTGQDRPFASSQLAFGNAQLWVVPIQQDGVIRPDPRSVASDGSISQKFGWWRVSPGTLSISGRRLDGSAPPLAVEIPDGYGSSGFQSSGVTFPVAGCWEIIGAVGDATLTFVTLVLNS